MYLKTTFPLFESNIKIKPGDLIYTCGSCFAQEFYDKLSVRKFQLIQHPFGIVFNPLSIARQFSHVFTNHSFVKDDLKLHNGLYHSFDHHGSYSHHDADIAIQNINEQNRIASNSLKNINYLVLTLGSAHFFTLIENEKVIANCHKFPQSHFTRKRADTEQITGALEQTFHALHKLNPGLQIILSISPVRYLKDGFTENSKSKAALLLATDYLTNKFSFASYFPAYEIFMDDLRDYRYVKDDLVHPNKAAIDYIWTYFEHAYLSEESKQLIADLNKYYQLSDHRVLNSQSDEYKNYISMLQKVLNELESNYKQIDFTQERNTLAKKDLRSEI